MASRNVETLRAAHQSWNRREFESIVRLLSDSCVYRDHARSEVLHGKQKIREYLEGWAKAWSDGKIKDPNYIDAGDVVIAEFTGEGTNDGPFGALPPTHRHASFAFCEVWHFDDNGRLTEGGCYYDLYTLFTQLGHLRGVGIAA